MNQPNPESPAIEPAPLYSIAWRSRINARSGIGTKQFTLAEAQELAEELNADYPDIEHSPVRALPPIQS